MNPIIKELYSLENRFSLKDNYSLLSNLRKLISDNTKMDGWFLTDCEFKNLKLHIEFEEQNYDSAKGKTFKFIFDIQTKGIIIVGNLGDYRMFEIITKLFSHYSKIKEVKANE